MATDLAGVGLADLNTDALVGAVAAAKRTWSDATVARMLSTLRGFTRWLTRRQALAPPAGREAPLTAVGRSGPSPASGG